MSNSIDNNTKPDEKTINLVDLFKYLLSYWKWFAISIILFGGYFLYQYSKTPFVYSRLATVMVKTSANSTSTIRMNRYNGYMEPVNVASEILQLHSKELMRNAVRRLGMETSYSMKKGLRMADLYETTPVKIDMPGSKPYDRFSFQVTPMNDKTVKLSFVSANDMNYSILAKLNTQVKTPVGRMKVTPTRFYTTSWKNISITVTKNSLEDITTSFSSRLMIKQMEDEATLLQVTLEDSSPQRASDLMNTLVTVYNEEAIEDKRRVGVNTAEFINSRIQIIEKELGSVESDIQQLKVANQGIDVNAASGMYVSDSRTFEFKATDLDTQLKLMELMKQYLKNPDKRNDILPSNTGLVDVNIENQINEYNKAVLKRNRLLAGNSDQNPVVQQLNTSVESMRQGVNRAVDNAISGLKIKRSNASQQEMKARVKAQDMPSKQRIILSVERQQKVKEELYIFLLNKREENALNQAMTDDNLRIIDPPSGSDSPIYPSRFKKIMMGIGIGVTVPAIILLFLLMLDTVVRTRKDIEDVITAPFLGEIPLVSSKRKDNLIIAVKEQGTDSTTEAFRILRTNIGFMSPGGKKAQVITITSFAPGSGKTFTTINLAASLAMLQKKIVILDLDMRKGTLTSRLAINKEFGVSHYLADENVTIEEIIQAGAINDKIDVIPIGVIAPNPTELLLGLRLEELIQELKQRYDYILVDNVPTGLVADASIIDRVVELTLFIIRAGKFDRRHLPELEAIYKQKKLKNLAVILNGIQKGGQGYGYYGYGYGGYGGYGYSNHKKSKWKFWKQ